MASISLHPMLLCCFCSIVFAFASHGPLDAAAQFDSSFKIRVDVDLATVEVIAVDNHGRPLRNLKKEDFQLYEDGKKQEILSVDEVRAEFESSSLGANPIEEKRERAGRLF